MAGIVVYVILYFGLFPKVICDIADASTTSFDRDKLAMASLNNTIVHFHPYVSILDSNNPYRYSFANLIPLVTKIASRFNKILVQQSEMDLEKDLPTSLSMSPMAIAEYNKVLGMNETKLEVWLSYASKIPDYSYENDDFIFHREPQRILDRLICTANQVNTIDPGTVSMILLPYKLLLQDMKNFLSPKNNISTKLSKVVNQWGVVIGSETFTTHPSFRKHISLLKPDMVIFTLPPLEKDSHLLRYFNTFLEHLQSFAGRQVKHGFILSVPDTDSNGEVDMFRLVTTWKQAIHWAEQNGTRIIFCSAFDKPSANTIEGKTNGWWRLVESHRYKNSTGYVFEEKSNLIKSGEKKETSLLRKVRDFKCKKRHVQTIFGLGDNHKSKTLLHSTPEETDLLFDKMGDKFDHVVLVVSDHSREAYKVLREKLNRISRSANVEMRASLLFMPSPDLIKILSGSADDFVEVSVDYRKLAEPITTYAVPFTGNQTGEIGNYLKYTVLATIGVSEYNYTFGYIYSASSCLTYPILPSHESLVIDEYIKSDDVKMLIFYFEEDEQTVKLGVDRMFHQRITVLEQCRKMVSSNRALDSVKLSFMMLHYSTTFGFYQNRREMITFADYWQMLSDWAEKTNSTVILNNAVDEHRYSAERGQFEMEIGWWRYNSTEHHGFGIDEIFGADGSMWVDKVEEFRYRFPDANKFQIPEHSKILPTDLIVLISLLCVLISIAIIIVILLLIRRKHGDECILKSEINEFFNGSNNKAESGEQMPALSIPYDKTRYEINTDAFAIQDDMILGTGEFGKVVKGYFEQDGMCIPTAVKTVNCTSVHKSSLTGLLSEIKVLSYVGKHENITELLAANTGDIRNGKVYMFLELCELGSLEKYLQQLRPTRNTNNSHINELEKKKSELDERVDKYLELVSKSSELEDDHSEDMYRWSQEICRGMEYLASKHVVHADMATRNVLLNSKKEAKICDFGLSRRMYNYTNYVKQQQEPLPWKWMSPEALRNLEFSEKSDVWAYGVTLWEIYSLAEQPYPGLTWHLRFADTLEEGLQLLEPKYNTNNMYWMMKECWQISPQCRPTFADLMKLFSGRNNALCQYSNTVMCTTYQNI